MRAVAQRVAHASATVDGETTGAIGRGVVVLLGLTRGKRGGGGFVPAAPPGAVAASTMRPLAAVGRATHWS